MSTTNTINSMLKLDNASVWCFQISPGRFCVTARNFSFEMKESLSRLKGANQIERGKAVFRMIIPQTSLAALREQCLAFGIPVQMIETDTAPVAISQRQRQIDDGRKRGRFVRFGSHWTFRFDR